MSEIKLDELSDEKIPTLSKAQIYGHLASIETEIESIDEKLRQARAELAPRRTLLGEARRKLHNAVGIASRESSNGAGNSTTRVKLNRDTHFDAIYEALETIVADGYDAKAKKGLKTKEIMSRLAKEWKEISANWDKKYQDAETAFNASKVASWLGDLIKDGRVTAIKVDGAPVKTTYGPGKKHK